MHAGDKLPANVAFFDVERVLDDVGGGGYATEKAGDEYGVFVVGVAGFLDLVQQGNHVNLYGAVVKGDGCGIDVGTLGSSEHVGGENVDDFVYGLAFEDYCPANGFFGFAVVEVVIGACSTWGGALRWFHGSIAF